MFNCLGRNILGRISSLVVVSSSTEMSLSVGHGDDLSFSKSSKVGILFILVKWYNRIYICENRILITLINYAF